MRKMDKNHYAKLHLLMAKNYGELNFTGLFVYYSFPNRIHEGNGCINDKNWRKMRENENLTKGKKKEDKPRVFK